MEVSKILSADLLDIIFDGRNKMYGAYELRRTYSHRLAEALVITTAICLVSIGVPHLFSKFATKKETTQLYVKDVLLEDLKQEEKKQQELPPPPPPKQEQVKVEITKFTPPLIVKDAEVKEQDEIKEVSKLENTKIGTINQEGAKDEGVITAPPVEVKGTGVVEAPKQKEEDYDKIYTIVEIPAQFPGGQEAWQKYLERNLNRDLPIQNGAPVGKYVVRVSFIVDRQGNISEVKAENDPGYGTQEEAIRVIKKGPNWQPAVQNGRNVTYRHIQNIVFIVSESE
jgi:protein TonB